MSATGGVQCGWLLIYRSIIDIFGAYVISARVGYWPNARHHKPKPSRATGIKAQGPHVIAVQSGFQIHIEGFRVASYLLPTREAALNRQYMLV